MRKTSKKQELRLRPKTKTVLVLPDTHVPYHDKRAWSLFLQVAKSLRPDHLVLLGDFCDFYSVSQYPKDASRKCSLEWELEQTNLELDKLTGLSPDIRYCEGNHENRLARYLSGNAPQLAGVLNVKSALRIRERGWLWVPYKDSTRIGKFNFLHDCGRSGVAAIRQTLADYGGNVVFGHTHRLGIEYSGSIKGDAHVALNAGWLGDWRAIDYHHRDRVRRESRLGFGVVTMSGDLGFAQAVPIVNYTCVVNGKVFNG